MLKIGVQIPGHAADPGEYLADARALDAVGVDSLWIEAKGHDPWQLLAAVAAVTGRIRLVVPVAARASRDEPALAERLETLCGLSRHRAVVGLGADPTDPRAAEDVVAIARRCGCPVIAVDGQEATSELAIDGAIGPDAPPDALPEIVQRMRARGDARAGAPFEVWVRTPMPEDRAGWRRTRDDCAAAGATGLIVPADPRLLDLLRNGDEEDDRSDLALAQG